VGRTVGEARPQCNVFGEVAKGVECKEEPKSLTVSLNYSCGHRPDTASRWAPMAPRFCRECSERIDFLGDWGHPLQFLDAFSRLGHLSGATYDEVRQARE
jgi:hypothetical protein